jgi:hypothetical protein
MTTRGASSLGISHITNGTFLKEQSESLKNNWVVLRTIRPTKCTKIPRKQHY